MDAAPSLPDLTTSTITEALRQVRYPGLTRDLVSFGMVDHVSVCDRRVKVHLALRSSDPSIQTQLEASIAQALTPLGVLSVAVEIVPPRRQAAAAPRTGFDPWSDQVRLARARHVIAVGAGKGGVGKSTVAVNLALALARRGLRPALLDADIYGPSIPILLGIEDGAARIRMSAEKHIIPLEAFGLPVVSFGFFLGEGSPAVWRGPMVSKAVKQFTKGVAWPEVDVLVVDLPPGTGDIPLSLAQSVVLSGAIVVTQAARVAIAEARKACEMFRDLEVPVLGIVENMSGPFGRDTGRRVASEAGIPFLGTIPFDEQIIMEGDTATPTMAARPASVAGTAFGQIAAAVAQALELTGLEVGSAR